MNIEGPTPAPAAGSMRPPMPPTRRALDLEALVERTAISVGIEVEAERLRAAVAGVDRVTDEPEALRRSAEKVGMHARILQGHVAAIVKAAGPEHPVVTWTADGRWVLVLGRRGRRVDVEMAGEPEPLVFRVGELSRHLDPDLNGGLRFVAFDPPSSLGARGGRLSDSVGQPPTPPSPWVRLRRIIFEERQDIVVALIYAAGAGLLTLATPIAVQALVNTVAFGTLLQPVVVLTVLLLGGLIFAGVLRALQAWVVEVLQRRVFLRLVDALSRRLPRVELSAFDRAHGPELVNRFFDVFTIQKAASSLLVDGLEIFLTAFVGMLVLGFYHPLLLAFDVVLLGFVFVILFAMGRGATKTAVYESMAKYEVASWLEEVARHPAAFKLAGGPALARERADLLAASYLTRRKKHWRVVFRQLAGALSLQAFASAGILGIGGWLVIDRQLTLGQLVAAELIVTMVVASFAKVGKHLETTYDLLAALDKVGVLLDLPLEEEGVAQCQATTIHGSELAARNVTYSFDGLTPILEGANLVLAPGERVVLRGESGAGRSILVDLLLGLRSPQNGSVEIDGVDLADLDGDALRARTALVRGTEVVAGSIYDNVAFGRREVDVRTVRDALRAVGLIDDVAQMEDGLATRLMPDGSPLSRGQAARLVLARAIAGHPALLVIDGALDQLDPATRSQILETVFAEEAPWTLLVVTHADDISRCCSRTVTVADGTVHSGVLERSTRTEGV